MSILLVADLWINMSISYTYLQSDYEGKDRFVELSTALLQEEWKELPETAIRTKLESYAAAILEQNIVIKQGAR